MSKRLQIMLDIETLGTNPNSIILEIGACAFDPETGETPEEFQLSYKPTVESCVEAGLGLDGSTLFWWFGQEKVARESQITANRTPLKECLDILSRYIERVHVWNGRDEKELIIWSNPPHFDVARLEEAYHATGKDIPWNHRWIRCCRTIWRHPVVQDEQYPIVREGTHHTALDDCKYQVKRLLWAQRFIEDNTGEKDEYRKVTMFSEDLTRPAWLHLLIDLGVIQARKEFENPKHPHDLDYLEQFLTEEEKIHWSFPSVVFYAKQPKMR